MDGYRRWEPGKAGDRDPRSCQCQPPTRKLPLHQYPARLRQVEMDFCEPPSFPQIFEKQILRFAQNGKGGAPGRSWRSGLGFPVQRTVAAA